MLRSALVSAFAPVQDAAVLLEQFGVVLSGVLDTQLMYGLTAFAGASSAAGVIGGNRPAAATAAGGGGGGGGSVARRIALADLLQLHGFDHPHKKGMHDAFDRDLR